MIIYVVKTCDIHRMHSSMRNFCITTKPLKVIEAINGLIEDGDAVKYNDGKFPVEKLESENISNIEFEIINQHIDYVHIETYEDGELC